MKAFQSVIFVTLCLSLGSCDVPGTLVGFSGLASRASCLNTVIPICKDCNTVLKCLNVDPAPELSCKDTYPDRPFCSNGGCVAQAPSTCTTPFTCTGAGYYPDPLNCSQYHLCGAAGAGAAGTAYALYQCPTGFVYNPATTMCKLSSVCVNLDCTVDPYGYIAYPADNSFFVSCDPTRDPLILKCPANNVFQADSLSCVFQCPSEGRIADPSDKTKFFECYFNGATYFSQSLSCVSTYEFNAALQQCVRVAPPIPARK